MADEVEILGEIGSVETIASGTSVRAEVHWYEAHGRGRFDVKVKRVLG